MERRPDNKNRITKTGEFPQGTIENLGSSKEVDGDGKRSHEETV